MAADPDVRVRALAKVNLTLRVLGVRPDGYHELRTAFQALALHDTLRFTPTRGEFAVECDDPRCPVDRSNLVWRAGEALWRALRRGAAPGVRVRIRKRIPMQAGLGGGSSDAAAALRGLAILWRLQVSTDRLRGIARELGADVPFFLEGGTALGLDRGDLIFPLADWQPSWVVLVVPGYGISTKDAFGWFDEDTRHSVAVSSGAPLRAPQMPASNGLGALADEFRNDLEAPAAARHPDIAAIVARLRRAGATYAAMSGSGSAVFALFDTERDSRSAAAKVSRPHLSTTVTCTVGRRRYQRLSEPRLI
jgi:4-diphosphocytidyl-2-C-methyl-D-erythritol kinase